MSNETKKYAIDALKRMFRIYGIEKTEDKLKSICKNSPVFLEYHISIYQDILKGEI